MGGMARSRTPRRRAAGALTLLGVALALLSGGPAQAQCTGDEQCRGARACIDGACKARPCVVDVDCPDPQLCEAGICVLFDPGTAAPPPVTLPPPLPPSTRVPVETAPPPPPLKVRRPKKSVVRYRVEERDIPGLWIPGILVTAVTYVVTIPAGFLTNDGGVYSVVPIVGPWLMLSVDDEGTPYWVASGLLQLAGLTAIVLGASLTREVQVPVYALGDAPDAPLLSVLPTQLGRDGVGLGLTVTRF